ncbi:MAG TPA: TonB-dependent receptor [Beijerinckiaceae bacterium]|nr:TonB-dependent receptor [Beijerinckiaceae bacterium]
MSKPCAIRAAFAAGLIVFSSLSQAQQSTPDQDIVLTPGRSPQALARSGSAVSIIRSEELEKASPRSTADLLRQIPGVSVTEAGGPGQAATVRIRGSEARHTLVLIDGVRANDPSTGAAEFDFNALVPGDIERIEVLRGPQSALYGSDAVGGVVNIITRKGRGPTRGYASLEGGSYGSSAGKVGLSGGNQTFDYALALSGARGAGFSAYGYRIGRITAWQPAGLENDAFARLGANARFGWRPVEGLSFDAGITSSINNAQYDAAFGARPDTPSYARARLTSQFLRSQFDLFGGRLRNSVTLFANQTDRSYRDISYFDFGFGLIREWDRYSYAGRRLGAEYQGDLALDSYGKLIFGARIEDESLTIRTQPIETLFNTASREHARQQTRSLFALYQLPIGNRLDLSFGARIDDVGKADRFATWRLTGAYRIDETGTKVRASIGTGGKAPSLFQLYSPQYGTPRLEAERSIGVDAGIDQSLFGGRLTLSATAFHNRISNLIDFSPYSLVSFTYPACPVSQQFSGCYLNVGKAQTLGVELSGDAVLIEGLLTARAAYTNLVARDLATGLALARRPGHEGRVSFRMTPLDGLTIEPSVQLVGQRFSSAGERLKLAPYARFDLAIDYRINPAFSVFARGENLTGAKYQEIYNYGTTGRAAYAGIRAQW